jgi:hypothetical protein
MHTLQNTVAELGWQPVVVQNGIDEQFNEQFF